MSVIACKELLSSASSALSEKVFSDAKNVEIKRFHMVKDVLSAYVLVWSGLRSNDMCFELQIKQEVLELT